MQKIIVSKYNDKFVGIEVINDEKLNINYDYLELLYKKKKIKRPYNKNIGSEILIFYAKKEFLGEIIDRLQEHYLYSKATKKACISVQRIQA